MRKTLGIAVCLLMLLGAAAADDKPDIDHLVSELTWEQLAQKAVELHDAGDAVSFLAIARHDDNDPWILAEEFLHLGRQDLAEAQAQAVSGALVARLPLYVAAWRETEARRRERALWLEIYAANRSRDPKAEIAAAKRYTGRASSVLVLRIQEVAARGIARATPSVEARRRYEKLVAEADGLGWLLMSNRARGGLAHTASRARDFRGALAAFRSVLAFHREHGPPVNVIWGLRNVGVTHQNLGEYDAAVDAFREALDSAEEIGYRSGMARLHEDTARLLGLRGRFHEGLEVYEQALRLSSGAKHGYARVSVRKSMAHLQRQLGAYQRAGEALKRALVELEQLDSTAQRDAWRAAIFTDLGHLHLDIHEPKVSRSYYAKALDSYRAANDELRVAEVERHIADLDRTTRDLGEVLKEHAQRLATYRAQGQRANVANVLLRMARVHHDLHEHAAALRLLREAHEIHAKLGNEAGVARTLAHAGDVHRARGSLESALRSYQGALGSFVERGARANEALAHREMGMVCLALGKYAASLEHFERSLALEQAIKRPAGIGAAQNGIGAFYGATGQWEQARAWFLRAIKTRRSLDPPLPVGGTLVNLAGVLQDMGRLDEARGALAEALRPGEIAGRSYNRAAAYLQLGRLLTEQGDHAQAARRYKQARKLAAATGDPGLEFVCEASLAVATGALGDRKGAIERLRRALSRAEHMRIGPGIVWILIDLARLHLLVGDPKSALLTMRQAGPHLEGILGGLSEMGAAGARARYATAYSLGALAAARADAPVDMFHFIENGRAGALLETLGGRRVMRWTDLPAELRAAEQEARAAEARASLAYRRSLVRRNLEKSRERLEQIDAARDQVRSIAARIQREAKRQAGLWYPRAAPIDAVKELLAPKQVLVLYAFCGNEVGALVLGRKTERIVRLGTAQEIRSACAALDVPARDDAWQGAVARLQRLLVTPLLSLGKDVEQTLVSPDGALCYLPFGLLFAEKDVALTPSGTTHALLLEEPVSRGSGVLALGDPAYGGPAAKAPAVRGGERLPRLPATREEVKAIGDEVLLGAASTEGGLAVALRKRARWRAVHLACHGLVDTERPLLSSLALAPEEGSDGSLSALEVIRMDIPADLVVLSACETAKGKIQRAEGIVGLTRAFMYAGASRVLCSLWKVDDNATRALMVKFYELWNPKEGKGLGAAAALKRAQAFVRAHPDHPEWKHPYYWAAWVLWGLPD